MSDINTRFFISVDTMSELYFPSITVYRNANKSTCDELKIMMARIEAYVNGLKEIRVGIRDQGPLKQFIAIFLDKGKSGVDIQEISQRIFHHRAEIAAREKELNSAPH